MIRREIRDSEGRLLKAITEVDNGCKEFRREVRDTWGSREEGKRSITVAWIGGGVLLIAAILNTIATLFS